MAYYITYGEFQSALQDYYLRTGNRMQYPEMIDYLYKKGMLSQETPAYLPPAQMFDSMSDEEFDRIIDSFVIDVTPHMAVSHNVPEASIIPCRRDVYIIRHPRFTRPYVHTHNYFEVDFVTSGECRLTFENESRTLQAGELCIIAPSSRHDLIINDGTSMVYCIMIRRSTFNTTFFSLMSQNNLLSYFFRTILQGNSHSNYLLFYSSDLEWLRNLIRNALAECYKRDSFSNSNVINWIHLFFSHLLRNYNKTVQFYNYQMGTDFSLILQYIQHNYQTLTLASLAKFFHYSESHLSTLIKRNTGCSFTTLIKELRMADAVSYLVNTKMKISEIAECVGYNSGDHFSRVFRSRYGMSPQEYRRRQTSPEDHFLPMEMEGE